MGLSRKHSIRIFAELGDILENFGSSAQTAAVIKNAMDENPWFRNSDIVRAVDAIRDKMLRTQSLREWLERYPVTTRPKEVTVIMAGNIPLVGFFDMLCVICSGHRCAVKPSSKDTVLLTYIVELLKGIDPAIPIEVVDGAVSPQAVIATGSANANRVFKEDFRTIPALLRSSRTSVAVIDGGESHEQLAGLADDIFSYAGLGCRNVTHLLVPQAYDIEALARQLLSADVHEGTYPGYLQRRALLTMNGERYVDGKRFILREDHRFPAVLSEITYTRYRTHRDIASRIEAEGDHIQCIVSRPDLLRGAIPFGTTQAPGLTDYADNVDTMGFLCSL